MCNTVESLRHGNAHSYPVNTVRATADLSHSYKSVQLGVQIERFWDKLSRCGPSKQADLGLSWTPLMAAGGNSGRLNRLYYSLGRLIDHIDSLLLQRFDNLHCWRIRRKIEAVTDQAKLCKVASIS